MQADSTEIVSPGADVWIPLLVAWWRTPTVQSTATSRPNQRRGCPGAGHGHLASQSEARRAGPPAGRQERNTPAG